MLVCYSLSLFGEGWLVLLGWFPPHYFRPSCCCWRSPGYLYCSMIYCGRNPMICSSQHPPPLAICLSDQSCPWSLAVSSSVNLSVSSLILFSIPAQCWPLGSRWAVGWRPTHALSQLSLHSRFEYYGFISSRSLWCWFGTFHFKCGNLFGRCFLFLTSRPVFDHRSSLVFIPSFLFALPSFCSRWIFVWLGLVSKMTLVHWRRPRSSFSLALGTHLYLSYLCLSW